METQIPRQSDLFMLIEQYQGENIENNLRANANKLYADYVNYKENAGAKEMDDQLKRYEDTINSFIEANEKFYGRYLDPNEKHQNMAKYYVEHSQIHLTKLQSQYNQLVYRKQQCDNRASMKTAFWAIGITIFFSILSLIVSILGG